MKQMARLDNPNGQPFMVGDSLREWLKKDLDKVGKETLVVVFSHSPIRKIHKGSNFWTDEPGRCRRCASRSTR
jgi:Icc protein